MDILEMATANTRSDMNAAVNMETSWGKSVEMLPLFTIKEIEQHRQLSGKTPESAVIKTLDRGQKFKNECCITSDSIFTICDKGVFYVKELYKASMKKEKLLLELTDYSLSQFSQWGVLGETMQKAPVMKTTVQKQPSSKGITTLYDPCKVNDRAIYKLGKN